VTDLVLGESLAVRTPPLVPEIRLWLVASHVDLNARCAELLEGSSAPYWAFCWGSGQALARYVLDRPELVRGKTVVDFGAGSAVVAIAAGRAGAARVIAVDIDPKARRYAALNATLNGVELEVTERLPADWDVVLASDVLYEEPLARWLQHLADSEHTIYVSDPHRHGTPRLARDPIESVLATTYPDVDYPICSAFIYRL